MLIRDREIVSKSLSTIGGNGKGSLEWDLRMVQQCKPTLVYHLKILCVFYVIWWRSTLLCHAWPVSKNAKRAVLAPSPQNVDSHQISSDFNLSGSVKISFLSDS